MPGDLDGLPTDALEDIAYLSRSRNRVLILDALAAEARTRRELEETIGVARTTLDRIVNEFEERGWAERASDGTYVTTPVGEHVAAEFAPLVGGMQAIRTLGETVAWLPVEELSIGLHHFSGATLRLPEPNNTVAPAEHVTGLLREATEFSCLVRVAPPLAFEEAMRDGVVDGRLTAEHVITDGEFAYIGERPDRLRRWQEYLEAGANVYRYAGDIPCNLFVVDDVVLLSDRQPETCAFIESESEAVRSWARGTIGEYRAEADPLTAEAFTDRGSPSA
jgi:predicted transcriptional regulator